MSNKLGIVEGFFKECLDDIDAGVPSTPAVEEKEKENTKKVWVNVEFLERSFHSNRYKCKEITEEMAKGCSSAVQVSVPIYVPVDKNNTRRGYHSAIENPVIIPSKDVSRFLSSFLRTLGKDLFCPSSAKVSLVPECRDWREKSTGLYEVFVGCQEEHYSGQTFCSTCHALRKISLAQDRSDNSFPMHVRYDNAKAIIRKEHIKDPNREFLSSLPSTVIGLHGALVQTAFGTRSYYQDRGFDYRYIPAEACALWLTKNKPSSVERLKQVTTDSYILGTIEAIKAQKGKVPKGLKEDRYIKARDTFLAIVKILKSAQAKLDESSDTVTK